MADLMRFQFIKGEELRFLSHLDLLRTFERALRRAQIPMALTEGFHPKPKLSFASALAVGITSQAEYADLVLSEEMTPTEFATRLNTVLPPGLRIVRAGVTSEKAPALMSVVNTAVYRAELEGDTIPGETVERILSAEELLVERSTKKGTRTVDVRPLLYSLEVNGTEFIFSCAIGSEGNLRPEELVNLLGFQFSDVLLDRTGLFIRTDEGLCDPFAGIEVSYGN